MMNAPVPFKKPNVRALFRPDPGWLLVDADLSGADAQIVFAEAGEQTTIDRLRAGAKLHTETATAFFGERFATAPGDLKNKLTPKGRMYDDCKRAAHATNYGGGSNTVAAAVGWTRADATRFQRLWLRELHPGVGAWRDRVEIELRETRTTSNRFGYRIFWFDRIDSVLPEALAWGPQSAVAITTYRAAGQLRRAFGFVQFLLQVHDSLVFQIPIGERSALPAIEEALAVPIPYAPILVIPWKLAISTESWGEAQPWSATA